MNQMKIWEYLVVRMNSLENVYTALKNIVLNLWYVPDHVKKEIIAVSRKMFVTVKAVSKEMKMENALKSANQHAMGSMNFGPSVEVRVRSNFVHAKDF